MKNRLLFLLRCYATTVLVFIVAKVVFMLCNHEGHAFGVTDVWQVVWHGLSLDLSTALYFLILPLLATIAAVWVKVPPIILKVYFGLVATAFALAFVSDTSLYPFWGFKLDASCLQYLDTPTEAMASVSAGYLLLRLVLTIAVAVILAPLLSPLGGRTYSPAAEGNQPLPQGGGRERASSPYGGDKRGARWLETLLYLLLIPVFIIGIRGGLSESTTNIGQVYFSQNQFLNHSAVNPVFSFLSSFEKTASYVPDYQFMDETERQQLTDGLFPTTSIGSDTLLNTTRPNIVVILMESAGEVFAGAMPRLQQLKAEGVSFDECYANSWRTDRGTVCTWSGYPSFPTSSVMKMPSKTRLLPGIAKTLQAQGYATTYLYGGDINVTNMRSYLVGNGFEQLRWMKDYSTSEQQSAKWGVRDDITFQTLYDMVTAPHAEPFLIGFSTLSSHQPWDVPIQQLPDERDNAFYYLDQCIGQFVDRLRQTPQWDNLLIVLLPDHSMSAHGTDERQRLHNHIPLVWTGGAVRESRRIATICNQTDLAATLLGQLRLPHDDFRFSRDVLSRNYRHPFAIHTFNNAISMVDSTGFAVYDLDSHKTIVAESPEAEKMVRRGMAILQLATDDIKSK